MFIPRDLTQQLLKPVALIQILLGPRQCGKSTLLASLNEPAVQEISFDDLQMRQLANSDPALFLQQFSPPLLLDEVQYAPNIFPALKQIIDQTKRAAMQNHAAPPNQIMFRLTGSNQILLDKNIKESLAGRAAYYYLNTLSVHEIMHALPQTSLKNILFKGGWPELYTNPALSPMTYLNDYIRSYVVKDIVLSAGIQKTTAFYTVLTMLAARTGQILEYTDIAKDSGVSSVTIKEWIGVLERADLVYVLKPYFNNLNKRLIKSPKLYFLDTGLAVRLQGWSDVTPLLSSPQIGGLFETLVLGEIIKFIRNYQKNWQIFFWRTKDGDEIDFILQTDPNTYHVLEAKLSLHGSPKVVTYPTALLKSFTPKTPLVIVTYGAQTLKLSDHCTTLPINALHDYLQGL